MDLGRWENNKLQTVLGSLKDKIKNEKGLMYEYCLTIRDG